MCTQIYKTVPSTKTLDSYINGGKLDAFRHMFFMSAYAQKIKTRKIRRLGELHEKANYRQFTRSGYEEGESPDSLSCVMDLRNNEAGLIIGHLNPKITLQELADIVVKEIRKGNGRIMRRAGTGEYLDCSGRKIDLKKWRGIWNVPKCLVPSDTPYND